MRISQNRLISKNACGSCKSIWINIAGKLLYQKYRARVSGIFIGQGISPVPCRRSWEIIAGCRAPGMFLDRGRNAKGDEDMDLMIGTIDSKRLRKDLLHRYRTSGKVKSPAVQHRIDLVEVADEQQLVAIAKEDGMDLRPYIR